MLRSIPTRHFGIPNQLRLWTGPSADPSKRRACETTTFILQFFRHLILNPSQSAILSVQPEKTAQLANKPGILQDHVLQATKHPSTADKASAAGYCGRRPAKAQEDRRRRGEGRRQCLKAGLQSEFPGWNLSLQAGI